jgi:hypothetical protein
MRRDRVANVDPARLPCRWQRPREDAGFIGYFAAAPGAEAAVGGRGRKLYTAYAKRVG